MFENFLFSLYILEIRCVKNEELGRKDDWNIETVIDWKRIVDMYYQANGKVDMEDVHVEEQSS